MKLLIRANSRLAVIKEEFNKLFPYLQLEFTRTERCLTAERLMPPNITIERYSRISSTEDIEITPSLTVISLQQAINNIYGLGIKLLRKSGNIWLQATLTTNWTLEEQNNQGKALSQLIL